MDKDKLAHIVKVLNHLIDGLDELKRMPGREDCPCGDECHACSSKDGCECSTAGLENVVDTEHGDTGKVTRMEVKRGKVAIEALRVINGERQDTYGNPEDCFIDIAGLWSVYSGHHFTDVDVAIMMALLKIARMKGGLTHRDNFVDAIGYLALASDIVADASADNASSDAVDDD